MRNSLLFVLFISLTQLMFAQDANLTGKLVDDKTNEPLIGVIVFVDTTSKASTDVNGVYNLSLAPGSYPDLFQNAFL